MDFSKIKKLVQQNGDKFIFLENGEPELVVMSFEEYERMMGRKKEGSLFEPVVTSEELIAAKQREYREHHEPKMTEDFYPAVVGEAIGLPVRLEDIRLEDLPI